MSVLGRAGRALLLGLALVCAGADALAQAGSKPLPPAEDFARRPKLTGPTFSPDGKRFAAFEDYKDRRNVTVADLSTGKAYRVTKFERFDVASIRWINNERLVLTTTDLKRGLGEPDDQRGLYAVDADGEDGVLLSPKDSKSFVYVDRVKGREDDIFAMSPVRGQDSRDLVRLNTRTGQYKIVSNDNPGYISAWAVDGDNVPRAAWGRSADKKENIFWYRDTGNTPWRQVGRYPMFAPAMGPLMFDTSGSLYVWSNLETDKTAIYKFDPKANKLGEKVFAHPLVDVVDPTTLVNPLIVDPVSFNPVGVNVEGDRPEFGWMDERRARVQKAIDAALPPGNANYILFLPDGRDMVVSTSGSDPGVYYLFDEATRELKEFLAPAPWLKQSQLGRMQSMRYKARDGLEIQAYLTLPPGKEPKNLPLVVWVHGGPWARDQYTYNPDVQFLASRGYAVFQPNYRGSSGFGRKHLASGFKQLGLSMQDDVTDGVKHLIAQGVVDSKRICIGGGSYGGYATMMGLIREPGLFKCGIDYVGVTDLAWWIELGYTDFNRLDAKGSELWLTKTVGDPSTERAMMEASSPRFLAARVQAPVLIIHGGNDPRVPIRHAEAMRDALKAAGKPYEWLVFPEEAHGILKEQNRVAFYKKIEEFLARHIGQ